jgi:hypothetical protein
MVTAIGLYLATTGHRLDSKPSDVGEIEGVGYGRYR